MKILKKQGFTLLLLLVLSLWLGYFLTETGYNKRAVYYDYQVKTTISEEEVTSDFFKEALKKYKVNEETGEKEFIGYSYSSVKPDEIFENGDIKVSKDLDILTIKIKGKYFISSQGASLSEDSFNRFNKVLNKVIKFHDADFEVVSSEVQGEVKAYIVMLVCLGVTLIGELIYVLTAKKKDETLESKQFIHPFTKKFWVLSFNKMRKMKVFDLCFIAILFALQLLCKFIHIPTGFSNLGIGITYLVFSFICLVYGPIWGLVIGFFSDVLGYFIAPSGTFFYLGYTLQAMLTGFTYGIFLFNSEPTFKRCLGARLIVNILINAVFGSFLWKQVSGLTTEGMMDYFYFISLPKNILFLIPQALVMYMVLRIITKTLKSRIKITNEA